MAGTSLLRAPVNLGDNNGVGVDHRHLIMELTDLFLLAGLNVLVPVNTFIATAVPARVVMHSIADVIASDGIVLIVSIARLPACTGNPDNTRKAVFADFVDNGLEEVVHGLSISLALGVLQVHRLVS